ncbi:ATP:ADP antiporter, AAA family [Mariprofundus ferrinatatus]|uniref:ADP,ATP carrier protein n=1 Tax=Mariprofundus ferrinatatus TaxID=1921087 RepID=A0A2K8L2A9_9PROT|nr:Npt1/Npt2 family nucleotide transporter [Mariprofundus ferrinatatus]ATX81460.1 ATP:ADP antiporter, AAA family [Mariprofundus ferrinatatus]
MTNLIARAWADFRSPEGVATLRFAIRLFLILLAYYLLKPVREELILDGGSAEIRSYALAGQAALLLILVPFYSQIIKHLHGDKLFHIVTLFLAANIGVFYLLGSSGMDIGVPFFIWLGIFSVVQISQFWTMVSDYHCVEKGKRLTSYIAIGGSLGAMIGAMIAKTLYLELGAFGLMLLAIGMLVVAVVLPGANVEMRKDHHDESNDESIRHMLGGLKRVMDVPYLRWIAASVVLLNLINSTGEYILADFVTAEKSGKEIGEFYSTFYLYVNIATLVLQAFVVRPLYQVIGVGGALISLAVFNLSMYLSVLAFPVLAWFAIVKMADNSIDYSVANTTKQILFLPLDRFTRYEGMLAVNTFFTRFGDLIQGGIIFLVISVLALPTMFLVGSNIVLCLLWLFVTFNVSKRFKKWSKESDGLEEPAA